ncbi:MAG TPA: tetratricopeptide repeat protein [Candidatus Acidoferrales bacterium]|nr:tetratricopeptide repeat protein [Candidatus Acidoferrales bacterium]
MLAKINSVQALILLALALLLSGCAPAGPRALLQGKKCLDRGDVAQAVTLFKRATTLLATNANAWNYFGVALQRAGQAEEAANAYQTALRLDRDLVEAHYNLGVLWAEQNRPELAKAELTAYTLRRPNDVNGWLKLGYALLKTGDTPLAERSFSTVLSLKADQAEAYNGLGLARLQAGKFREAAQFFAAGVQARPDFGAALENLATVNLQYLHDSKTALADYQAYLNLVPRPANYYEVKSLVAGLVQSDAAATVMAPAVIVKTSPPPPEPKPKMAAVIAPRPPPVERLEQEEIPVTHPSPRPPSIAAEPVVQSAASVPTQAVHVRPEPTIVVAPRTNRLSRSALEARSTPKTVVTNLAAATEPLEAPMTNDQQHRFGFWHRLFKGDKPSTASAKRFREDTSPPASTPDATPVSTPVSPSVSTPGLAPAPASAASPNDEIAGTKPVEPKAQPVANGPRYAYTSPAKPAPGDRSSAEGGFTRARMAEQDENWLDAEQWYQMAAEADPSWFEAQYNTGVIAHRLHNYSVALPRYELALAIQPDSVDARYNFALALKAAGYALDAADQLKRILAANPDEVRAHLALANLYAQSLHDVDQARRHYLRVLDLQPDNPQAADIRFWLSANSESRKSD